LLDAPLAETLRVAAGPIPAGTMVGNELPRSHFHWPEAWQSLWTKIFTSSKRPAVVWTYAELGTDLRAQADAKRRQILRTMIDELHLPGGSHAFWPYCLPPDNAPEPEMFLAGLARFRPGLVLLAGVQARTDLAGLGALPSVNFQIASCRGFRFILLPGLTEIAEMPGPRREQLIAFIRKQV